MSIKAIITGSTGRVGEGVLHECINHPQVESVLLINRKPCSVQHEKLKEIIHTEHGISRRGVGSGYGNYASVKSGKH